MIKFTKHGISRMNQRGITLEMIYLTLEYGEYVKDKVILKSKNIKTLLPEVSHTIKAKLLKVLDKDGLVVVLSDENAVITVYNKFK